MPRTVLGELSAVFVPRAGLAMEYRRRVDGGVMIVCGASAKRGRAGSPLVTTRAELALGIGPLAYEVVTPGRAVRVERMLDPQTEVVRRDRPPPLGAQDPRVAVHEVIGEPS